MRSPFLKVRQNLNSGPETILLYVLHWMVFVGDGVCVLCNENRRKDSWCKMNSQSLLASILESMLVLV